MQLSIFMTTKTLTNHFPLARPHCGSTLGNGLQGLLVWGDKTLRLTVAHAGFWDHRGGQVMLPTTTFAAVRSRLEADDEPVNTAPWFYLPFCGDGLARADNTLAWSHGTFHSPNHRFSYACVSFGHVGTLALNSR